MNKKRGQVTILVIVGILLLFSVTMVLYLQNNTLNKQLEAQAKKNINDFLQLNAIDYYVTTCLDRVGSEGLRLLAEQGAYIYDYQGGLINTTNFQEGINYLPFNETIEIFNESGEKINFTHQINVSYVITDRLFCPAYYRPEPINYSNELTSFYPAKRLHLNQYLTRYGHSILSILQGCNGLSPRVSSMSGFLGKNELPKLFSNESLNKVGDLYGGNFHFFEIPGEQTSIQRQLETYIKNNLQKCIDFDYFTKNLTNYNITVDQNNTVIKTVFKDPRGLEIRAEYPFKVSVAGKEPIIQQVDFKTDIDIRIKQLYAFIYKVISLTLKNPFFNYQTSYTNIGNYLPSYHFELIRNACGTNCQNSRNLNDDILKIFDDTSKIHGNPLIFYFAIKQRKPILDYLHDDTQSSYLDGEPLDFLYYVNSTITLDPKAIDPDLDNITFSYSGWKETYDQEFNYTCCQEINCGLENHTSCIINISSEPHNWTSSQDFIASNRTARIKTNSSDVGYHEVFITVTDEHGAKDYQKVRLLIFDLPVAILTGKNNYSDVNNNYSSIEDTYILDGSASRASSLMGGNISKLLFYDDDQPLKPNSNYYFFYNTTNKTITLPFENYDFSNITLLPYELNVLFNQNTTIRKPKLIVAQNNSGNTIYSAPTETQIIVSKCLVHGYNNGTRSYPPPNLTSNSNIYHWDIGSNNFNGLFKAPHVCCKPLEPEKNSTEVGAGTLYDSNQVCLDFSFKTCYPLERTYVYLKRTLKDVNNHTIVFVNKTNYGVTSNNGFFKAFFDDVLESDSLGDGNSNLFNDIFNVSFEQYCSGLRGNTCGGNVSTKWMRLFECSDFNDSIDQFARCQGPSKGYSCVGAGIFNEPLTCKNYSRGQSFEKMVRINNNSVFEELVDEGNRLSVKDGFCAPGKEVSVKLTNYRYFSTVLNNSGKIICNGSCNGKGACDFKLNKKCYCKNNPSLKAEKLFTWQPQDNNIFSNPQLAKFVCESDSLIAYNYNCEEKTKNSKEVCWCRKNNNDGTTYNILSSFDGFFSASDYCSELKINNNNDDMCCVSNNIIVLKQGFNPNSNSKTCYKGNILNSPETTNSTSTSGNNILSCKGELFQCCPNSQVGCSQTNLIHSCTPENCFGFNDFPCNYNCTLINNRPVWDLIQ